MWSLQESTDMPRHQHSHHGHERSGHRSTDRRPGTAIDPVCGMSVDVATAKHRHSYGGSVWHFCSRHCLDKFGAEPQRYAKVQGTATPRAGAAGGTTYTCPMHPEIRQQGPGNCPKCGMALEPVVASAEYQPNPELVDMTRR